MKQTANNFRTNNGEFLVNLFVCQFTPCIQERFFMSLKIITQTFSAMNVEIKANKRQLYLVLTKNHKQFRLNQLTKRTVINSYSSDALILFIYISLFSSVVHV